MTKYSSITGAQVDFGVKEILAVSHDEADRIVVRRVAASFHSPESVIVTPTDHGHMYSYGGPPFAEYINGKLLI